MIEMTILQMVVLCGSCFLVGAQVMLLIWIANI